MAKTKEFTEKQCDNNQVKSRKRVENHGEVFTSEREVKAMCDLVQDECNRIESRFLEPACGNGNFLAEILDRKLKSVKRLYRKNTNDFAQYSFLAVSSIYGVELLADNANECRERLFLQYKKFYKQTIKKEIPLKLENCIKFILSKNILCGNALTLKQVDKNQKDLGQPIVFAEWSFVQPGMVKRRDFRLDVLLAKEDIKNSTLELFDDLPQEQNYWMPDPVSKELIPKPIKEFSLCNYLEVGEQE